ncbi:MAG TPA: hypothetical protein VFB29_00485 [Pseudolabrys sp.]|nr:hypothetical protein [Pseudolabrys sp.]
MGKREAPTQTTLFLVDYGADGRWFWVLKARQKTVARSARTWPRKSSAIAAANSARAWARKANVAATFK